MNHFKPFDDESLYTWGEAIGPIRSITNKAQAKKQTYQRWCRMGVFPRPDVKISERTKRYTGVLLNRYYSDPDAWREANGSAAA